MENVKSNNVNQRYYPLRDPENPSKVTLVPIAEEQYRSLYPEIWATQKREQYHHRCMCPKCYLWKCDGQCDLCEYHASDSVSLDDPLPDGEGTLGDYVPDDRPSIEDVIADRDLLKRLIARFRKLDPDADLIIQMRLDDPKISDRKIAEALGRPQRTFADQMKRIYTELHREKTSNPNRSNSGHYPSSGWWSEFFLFFLRSNCLLISSGS